MDDRDIARLSPFALIAYDKALNGIPVPTTGDRIRAMCEALKEAFAEADKLQKEGGDE